MKRISKSKRMTAAQRDWCKRYYDLCGFEALMDDFKAGNESFMEAARKSVHWLQDVADDVSNLKIPRGDE